MEQPFEGLTAKASSQETEVWDLSKEKRFSQKIEISLLRVTN